MRRRWKQSGLSMVELATGSIVVAVSLLGTVAAVVTSSELANDTTEARASARVVTTVMEQIRATDFDDLETTFHNTTIVVNDAAIGDSAASCAISVTEHDRGVTTTNPLYRVGVTISFDAASGQKTATYETYVSDRTSGSLLGTP